MALITRVEAPDRKPRSGGIKDIVGEFITEERLSVTEAIAWEDSGCALPSLTQAGCYDVNFPLEYDPVVTISGRVTITWTRFGDQVIAEAVVEEGGEDPTADIAVPWPPTESRHSYIGDGEITIGPDGSVLWGEIPTTPGAYPIEFETKSTNGGRLPEKTPGGVEILEGLPPFVQYAGVKCYLGGDADGPTYAEQSARLLEQTEDREISRRLLEYSQGGVNVSQGLSELNALVEVERHALSNYVGQPLIVTNVFTAFLAHTNGGLVLENGRLYTPLGNPVLVAPGSDADEDGDVIFAAIGWPAVYASQARSYLGPKLSLNQAMGLTERAYAIGVDCEYRVYARAGSS